MQVFGIHLEGLTQGAEFDTRMVKAPKQEFVAGLSGQLDTTHSHQTGRFQGIQRSLVSWVLPLKVWGLMFGIAYSGLTLTDLELERGRIAR